VTTPSSKTIGPGPGDSSKNTLPLHRIVLVAALFSATAGGASTLQRAGSIAAIVGASVAVLLLLAGVVRWWLRHRRVWSVKPTIFTSGEELYLKIDGLPASTAQVQAFVNDGDRVKRFGPDVYRRDIAEVQQFNLRTGQPTLDESAAKYRVEVITFDDLGQRRRVYKRKVKTPW
jgi:hypothetical protein